MNARQAPEICGHCHLPIHPSEIGKRYFGTSTAHQEYRCLELLRMKVTEAERQRDALAEALRICRGFVDAYGQPETKERLDAILARVAAEKEPTDAR